MPDYTDLPPDWVWAVAHWAVIIAGFSPIILPLCIMVLAVLFNPPREGLDRFD